MARAQLVSNAARGKMQIDRNVVSTDAFLLNVGAALLRLANPVVVDDSKVSCARRVRCAPRADDCWRSRSSRRSTWRIPTLVTALWRRVRLFASPSLAVASQAGVRDDETRMSLSTDEVRARRVSVRRR